MAMKIKRVYQYLLRKNLIALGEMYGASIIIFVGLPIIFGLLIGNFDSLRINLGLSLNIIAQFFLFFYAMFSYEEFKFLIQNGISRRTYFYANITSYATLVTIVSFINFVYLHIFQPQTRDFYTMNYEGYFNNPAVNLLLEFIIAVLSTLVIGLIGMLVGSFLSIFSKKVQGFIIVTFPILGLFVLLKLVQILWNYQVVMQYVDNWIVSALKLFLGYSNVLQMYNPLILISSLIITSGLLGLIIRSLFDKKQLKR